MDASQHGDKRKRPPHLVLRSLSCKATNGPSSVWRLSQGMIEEAMSGWPSVSPRPTYHVSAPSGSRRKQRKLSKQELSSNHSSGKGVVERLYIGSRKAVSPSCMLTGYVDEDCNYHYNSKALSTKPNYRSSSLLDSSYYWSDGDIVSFLPGGRPSVSTDTANNCHSVVKNTGEGHFDSSYYTTKASAPVSVLDLLTLPSRKRLRRQKRSSASKVHLASLQRSGIGTSLPDIQKLTSDLRDLEIRQATIASDPNMSQNPKYGLLNAKSGKVYFTEPSSKTVEATQSHRPHGAFGTITINPTNPSIPTTQTTKKYYNLEVQGIHPHKQFYKPFFNDKR